MKSNRDDSRKQPTVKPLVLINAIQPAYLTDWPTELIDLSNLVNAQRRKAEAIKPKRREDKHLKTKRPQP